MKKTYGLTLALGLSLLASSARADVQVKEPSPQIRSLHRMVGEWKGFGTWDTKDGKANIQGTWTCREASGGFSVVCDLSVPGKLGWKEIHLFMFEQATQRFHWITACSWAQLHDFTGTIEGDLLSVKDAEAQVSLHFIGERSLDLRFDFKTIGLVQFRLSRSR